MISLPFEHIHSKVLVTNRAPFYLFFVFVVPSCHTHSYLLEPTYVPMQHNNRYIHLKLGGLKVLVN